MTLIVVVALVISFAVYLFVGFSLARGTKNVGDMLPLTKGRQAQVKNQNEFSASTVAATISLATVVLTFYELAPIFGPWLFWCVLTTSAGIYVVRLFARPIWEKINNYDHRPSLHEFIATEFASPRLAVIAALSTSLGFLGAFAVELTVGSRFLASLMPQVPFVVSVLLLSTVAFIYCSAGGFRAAIVTDRIQMFTIWGFLIVMVAFYVYYITVHGGFALNIAKLPKEVTQMNTRDGLIPFLIGIFIINVPTFIADMSIWQRIGAAQQPETIFKGLWFSVISSGITWGLIVLLSLTVFIFILPKNGVNNLFNLMNKLGQAGPVEKGVVFFTVLGLFGAMLSTASTQLIVTSHAIYEDIIAPFRNKSLSKRLADQFELKLSRSILIAAAIFAILIVELLNYWGFSIADLIFSIYGSQLGLVMPVLLALFAKKELLLQLKNWAAAAIILGFLTGWASAVIGKMYQNDNLVFLAPCASLGASSLILGIGYFGRKVVQVG